MTLRPAARRAAALAVLLALLAATGCDMVRPSRPRGPDPARTQLQRAQEAIAAQDTLGARQALEQAAAGGQPRARLALAKFLTTAPAEQRDPVRAAVLVADAYRQNSPLKGEAAFQLARLYAAGEGVPKDEARARQLLEEAVMLGHAPALPELARVLAAGIGGRVDPMRAQELYRRAAEAGNARASFRAAELGIEQGMSESHVQADAQRGIDALTAKATGGDVAAMRELAQIYGRGTLVPADPDRQRFWLETATGLGDLASAVRLAALREQAGDVAGALGLYQRAGEQGDATATAWLALHYLKTAPDGARAVYWADRAVALGNAPVMEAYGTALLAGEPVPVDARRGAELLEQAVAAGRRGAATRLARIYLEGSGVPRDPARAVELLTLAAEGGSTGAMVTLARLHLAGDAVPADPARGVSWLQRAAEAGHVGATAELGKVYLEGRHVPADPARGVRLLAKAAEAGHAGAMAQLGRLYLAGRGVPANGSRGMGWLQKAAAAGHKGAEVEIAKAWLNGRGVKADPERGVSLLRRAARAGNPEAMALLGRTLVEGRRVPADPAEGERWLARARAAGARTVAETNLAAVAASRDAAGPPAGGAVAHEPAPEVGPAGDAAGASGPSVPEDDLLMALPASETD